MMTSLKKRRRVEASNRVDGAQEELIKNDGAEDTGARAQQELIKKEGSDGTQEELIKNKESKDLLVMNIASTPIPVKQTLHDDNSKTASRAQQQVALAAQRVFRRLGCGFSESVYRDALCIELQHLSDCSVRTDCEVVYPVQYRGRFIGTMRADIVMHYSESSSPLVDERLLIELKTTNTPLNALNARQLLTYLRLDQQVCRGVLINFEQRDSILATRVSAALSTAVGDETCIVDDAALFDECLTDSTLSVCGHHHTAKVLYFYHSAARRHLDT